MDISISIKQFIANMIYSDAITEIGIQKTDLRVGTRMEENAT